jgi:signal transduction histidine kinase
MSIKLRLALLLGLLLLVFLFCLLAFRAMESKQVAEAVAAARRDDAELLENWLDLRSAPLRRFLDDTAGWDELAAFAAAPAAHPRWPSENLDPLLPNYGVDALWIAAPDGTLLHAIHRSGPSGAALPVPSGKLTDLAAPEVGVRAYFFPVDGSESLFEVRSIRLAGPAAPWLFVARLWDPPYLAQLGDLTDSTVDLAPPSAAGIAAALHGMPSQDDSSGPAPIVVQRALPGWNSQPIRTLRLLKSAPDVSFRIEADRLKTRVFLLFGLCLIASLAISLHKWVLQPLGWITESLSRHDTTPIQPLLRARTELTRVARLIVTSFEHREQLRREIAERRHAEAALQKTLEERARLGRDLHDGLIQSIYAAGMGLAAARKRVADDPSTAERHLAQVATVLNDTIREVRDFITGLEPENRDDLAFTHTVERLFATMNADDSARSELSLDETVAARFPSPLRTELLLLLRESISNALRHGHAHLVRIHLALDPTDPDLARLEITDDGDGFDPASAKRGRGLDNLFARAASHGARASLDSGPGRGTRLSFAFPLPPVDESDEDPTPLPARPSTPVAPGPSPNQ